MSIPKFLKTVSLLILLLSLSFIETQAVSYRISDLIVDSSGFSSSDEPFELRLSFSMKSISGFGRKRFKVELGDNDLSANLNSDDAINISLDSTDSDLADIEMNIPNVNANSDQDNSRVKLVISYFISSTKQGDPLIEETVNINLGDSFSNGNSSKGSGATSINNELKDQRTEEEKIDARLDRKAEDETYLAVIEVNDISYSLEFDSDGVTSFDAPGNLGDFSEDLIKASRNRVSDRAKRFQIIIHHDSNLIPDTEAATFQEDNSAIVSSLFIGTNLEPDDYELTDQERDSMESFPEKEFLYDITDKFTFSVFEDTRSSTRNSSLSQSIFYADIEDSLTQNLQKLVFRIKTRKLINSLDANIVFPFNTKATDNFNIDLKGILATNESIELSQQNILLIPVESEKKNRISLKTKDPLNLSIDFAEGLDLASVDSNQATLSGISYRSRFSEFADDVKDSLLRTNIEVDDSSIISSSTSLSFDFDLKVDARRNALLLRKELFRDTISKNLFLNLFFAAKNSSGLELEIESLYDDVITLSILDEPKIERETKAKARFRSKEKKNGETIEDLRLAFFYSNILSRRRDPLELDIKFLDAADNELSGNVFTIPNISKLRDVFTNTEDATFISRRKIKLNAETVDASNSPLGESFMAEARTAAKLELSLRRATAYLNSLNLSDDDEINSILNDFTNRRIVIEIKR